MAVCKSYKPASNFDASFSALLVAASKNSLQYLVEPMGAPNSKTRSYLILNKFTIFFLERVAANCSLEAESVVAGCIIGGGQHL
jgi:hypothetical protein